MRFGLILALLLVGANALKCPILYKKTSARRTQNSCWDSSPSVTGCCATGLCAKSFLGFLCECDSRCRGWSVDLAKKVNYEFGEKSVFRPAKNEEELFGRDDECQQTNGGRSARINANSCVKFWEKPGCTGKHVTITGGVISDITLKGLSDIQGISGCTYTPPKSVEIKLYQHSIWSMFGSSEKFVIKAGECKYVGDWWDDRASMIQPKNDDCYKIWEHRDCTGASYCDCGRHEFGLRTVQMTTSVSWNNQISSLSLCDYSF